ncbi:uncharacterized protein LOC105696081 isoform X2 [Orussus abietinus]|uniref:uncharacterized protein LOC105696081 isoform X2 n=1 Tax=Orussus abietinus TaxID=222816 RepID=UPI0006254136|nr:uncharacterized protein LOC105696081 isoform X2 [Orussus abietinus]
MKTEIVDSGIPFRRNACRRVFLLPRHGAVDEESPGSSSKRLSPSSDCEDSVLEISLRTHQDTVFIAKLPTDQSSGKPDPEEAPQGSDERSRSTISERTRSEKRRLLESTDTVIENTEAALRGVGAAKLSSGASDLSGVHCKKSSVTPSDPTGDSSCEGSWKPPRSFQADTRTLTTYLEELESSFEKSRDPLRPGDSAGSCSPNLPADSPEEIPEVRKDSSLYLEETEGLRGPREDSRPPRLACRILAPRRQSSGYASNLGTFDEDPRSAEVEVGPLRGRRRSSAKRLDPSPRRAGRCEEVVTFHEESASSERMPATEVPGKVSTAGLDMPDIQEVRDAELPEAIAQRLCTAGGNANDKPLSGMEDLSGRSSRPGVSAPEITAITDLDTLRGRTENPGKEFTVSQRISHPEAFEGMSKVLETFKTKEVVNPNVHKNFPQEPACDDLDRMFSRMEILPGDKFSRSITSVPVNSLLIREKKISTSRENFSGKETVCDSPSYTDVLLKSRTKASQSGGNMSHLDARFADTETTSSPESFRNVDRSLRLRKGMVHQFSTPNFSRSGLGNTSRGIDEESPGDNQKYKSEDDQRFYSAGVDDADVSDVIEKMIKPQQKSPNVTLPLPRSVKVYQLLSTQSEDRGDGVPRLNDRRISLQITRHEDDRLSGILPSSEEKKLLHAESVPMMQVSGVRDADSRLLAPGVSGTCTGGKSLLSSELASGHRLPVDPTIRPIYPYCPYSPYGSPQGSPRTQRRPLRESRRVSLDNRQGALQLNQYKLLDNIGQGSFGIVKLCYNEEDEAHYAMKILSKKKLMKKAGIFGRMAPGRKGASSPLEKVYREIALLKKLDHPNVVKLVEVLDDPDEDNLYLVFELVQRGEVLQVPTDQPLDEKTARKNFRDVVMGIEYLHYQRIVHRDIKPSNLLVDGEGRVKIADLGVSAELREASELLTGSAGTPAFAAPETTTPGARYSGTLCDVWSMGVTLFSLVTGRIPWDGSGTVLGVQSAVRTEPLKFPEKPELSKDVRDLINHMTCKNPVERITLPMIKEHPWLTNHGLEPLPSEADNCRLPVTVTDEEVARVVTRVPKLDTLILIKTMLKQHSFQNPFLQRRASRTAYGDNTFGEELLKAKSSSRRTEAVKMRTEQFHKSGRSNSAPDSYEWHTNGRQVSVDSALPPVTEASSQETDLENR